MSIKRLVIPLCAALALGVAACGSDDEGGGDSTSTIKEEKGSPAQSKPVTIAFSAPGADHGWMAAITENARKQADELVVSMNRAAEMAVKEATPILVDSVKKMSVQDAKGVLTGGDDAATQYFRRTTSGELTQRFLPIVKKMTSKVQLVEGITNDSPGTHLPKKPEPDES